MRRRINNRASARRVRQKREEELQRISAQVHPNPCTMTLPFSSSSWNCLKGVMLNTDWVSMSAVWPSALRDICQYAWSSEMISAQVATLDHEKQQLAARVSQSQASCGQLAMQLKQIRERWQMTCLTNATLHKELMNLRDTWQVPATPSAQALTRIAQRWFCNCRINAVAHTKAAPCDNTEPRPLFACFRNVRAPSTVSCMHLRSF